MENNATGSEVECLLLLHRRAPYACHETGEDDCRSEAAACRCPCRTFHSHGGEAPVAEDKGVVAEDIQYVYRHGGHHGL